MTTPQAVLAAAALIALAIVFADPPSITAEAQLEEQIEAPAPTGLYQIATQANSGNVWQVNTRTGELRLCQPPSGVSGPPRCFITGSPWQQ